MRPESIVILGGGGHARVLISCFEAAGQGLPGGILDSDRTLWGRRIDGVPVLGDDAQLPALRALGIRQFLVGLGAAGDNRPRQRLFVQAIEAGLEPVAIAHPSAIRSPRSMLGPGSMVYPLALINPGTHVGQNVIVNSGAILEHDGLIGDHAHIAPRAVLGGSVRVGALAHVGIGSTVRQGIVIGEGAIVGAGAVVVADIEPWTVVAGVPARPMAGSDAARAVAQGAVTR